MADKVNQFLIGSWITYFDYEKMSHEEQMQRLVRLGVNYQPFPYAWYQPERRERVEDWKEIDRLCQKYGVLYGLQTAKNGNGATDEAFALNTSFGEQLSDNLIVYDLCDEPEDEGIEPLGEWVRRYRAASDKAIPTVNLLPSYAGEKRLGSDYPTYLQRMIDAAGADNMAYLSADFYLFKETEVRWYMFRDLEDMRSVALKNGKMKTHAFIQACKWKHMRMPNIDEMRWQAYANLAYGIKAMSYFNIVMPRATNAEGYTDGLITQEGEVLHPELLEEVGRLNADLHAVGNQLFPMHALHAYHTSAVCDGIELLPENYPITPVDRQGKFVVTEWDNQRYFMLFNNDFEREAEAEFIVKGATRVSVFNVKTNEYEACALHDGKIKVAFAKGEGLLFRKN